MLRWAGRKQSSDKSLSVVIDLEGNFNFRQYVYVPTGIHRIKLFEEGSSEASSVSRSLTPVNAQFHFSVVAHASFLFMLESKKGRTVYNPKRATCQFGYNQGAVVLSGDHSTSMLLWRRRGSGVMA